MLIFNPNENIISDFSECANFHELLSLESFRYTHVYSSEDLPVLVFSSRQWSNSGKPLGTSCGMAHPGTRIYVMNPSARQRIKGCYG